MANQIYVDGKDTQWRALVQQGTNERVVQFYVINGDWTGDVLYGNKQIMVRDSTGTIRNIIEFENSVTAE